MADLGVSERIIALGNIYNDFALRHGGQPQFNLSRFESESLGLNKDSKLTVEQILTNIKKRLKLDEKTEQELPREAKRLKRNEIIRQTLEKGKAEEAVWAVSAEKMKQTGVIPKDALPEDVADFRRQNILDTVKDFIDDAAV